MNHIELQNNLKTLGLRQSELAFLLGVTPRAVNLWATGKHAVPNPVEAYLRLFINADDDAKAKEYLKLHLRD